MLVLYHKHNAVSKMCDFRAGIFCISNRFKEGKGTSKGQGTGAALLWWILLHPLGGMAVRAAFKVGFCPEQHLCTECSYERYLFSVCQSCMCSVQMHLLWWGFIFASKQCQHSHKRSSWSCLLQRQQLRSFWWHLTCPQLLTGLQICPGGTAAGISQAPWCAEPVSRD